MGSFCAGSILICPLQVYESYGDRVDSPREPKEALLDLAGSGIPRPPSSKPPQSGSNHSGRSIPSGIDTTESPVPPPAPSPELVAAVVQRENSAVPERALLRQALFVLHGIDGDLVKSDPTGNGHPSVSDRCTPASWNGWVGSNEPVVVCLA